MASTPTFRLSCIALAGQLVTVTAAWADEPVAPRLDEPPRFETLLEAVESVEQDLRAAGTMSDEEVRAWRERVLPSAASEPETLLPYLPNDDCAFPEPLIVPSSVLGSTVGATPDGAPACGGPDTEGVWYSVIGTGNTMTVETCAFSDQDTVLSVYCGDCVALTCVAGNDDACGFRSSVTWCSAPGVEYRVLVHGGGIPGAFSLDALDDGTPCAPATGACDPASIPTLPEWGLAALLVLLGTAGWFVIRRQG